MSKGTVILLNGTSSAGKTSISKQLKLILEEEYIYLSVDDAIGGVNDMLFRQYGEQLTKAQISTIESEEYIENAVISLFHHQIMAFTMIGHNVIVDHVLINPEWLAECVTLLHDKHAIFVGVHCPIEELERRERDRGDRPIGLARSQMDIVHQHGVYDLELDTNELSTAECANRIKEYMKTNHSSAFQKLFIT